MQGLHLDHIAIAVKNLSQARKVYQDIGFVFLNHIEEVVSQKVKTQFCQIDQKSRIELLEPTSPESTVAKFIQKHGEGVHHLCFRVPDVKAKQKELASKGYKFIYEKPISGADHCLVNFIHPSSTGGILIEISEKVKA